MHIYLYNADHIIGVMDIQIYAHHSSMRTFPNSFNCSGLCLLFVASNWYIHLISNFINHSFIGSYHFIIHFLFLSLGNFSVHHSILHSINLNLLYLCLFNLLFLCFLCYLLFFHPFNIFHLLYLDFILIFI